MATRFNSLTGKWEPVRPAFMPGPVPPALARRPIAAPPSTAAAFAPRGGPPPRQSAPAGGMGVGDVLGLMGQGLAAPFQATARGMTPQQGGNEPRVFYEMRQGMAYPWQKAGEFATGAAKDVGQFVNEMTATPNNPQGFFNTFIVQQESGGRQFDSKGNPLVGRDRQGRVPGASRGGPAIGVAQIQEGTARETAQKHGIAWDPNRWKNDPAYNHALGERHFADLYKRYNGNMAMATAAYHSGSGTVDKAVAQHGPNAFVQGLGPEGRNYVQTIFSKAQRVAGAFGEEAPSFDPSYHQYAIGAVDKAAQLMDTPFSADFTEAALPTRPEPTPFAAPDFSAGDAAFEETRPKNPFDDPKEKVRLERQQYWKGIGQAMASLGGDEGIGTMLMRLGAGALAGRARGQEMVDEKEAEFERHMVEFNRALASRNDQKATTEANVLNSNIQQRNVYADQIWQDNVKEILSKRTQFVDGKMVSYERDPEDSTKWKMTVTPLGFGNQSDALLKKAEIGMSMGTAALGQANFQHQSQQVAARTALGIATNIAIQQGQTQAAGEGLVTEATRHIRATVNDGRWRELLGNDTGGVGDTLEDRARTSAYQALGIQTRGDGTPVMPLEGNTLSAFQEMYRNQLTSMLFEAIGKAGKLDMLFTNPAASSSYTAQRAAGVKERQSTNAKGQTSTGFTYGEIE